MKASSRREFLIQSGALGAAALAGNWLPRSAYCNPLGRPIGIQLYAVNLSMQENPAGTLKALKEIGFGEVETAGLGKLSRQRPRHAHQRVLRRAIGSDIGVARHPRRRGKIDDAAAPCLQHLRQNRLRAAKGGMAIDRRV